MWVVYLGGGNTATELAVKTASLDASRTTVLARMYLDRDLFNPGRVDEPLPVAGSRAGLSYYYRCDRSEANQTCYEERSEVRRVDGIRSRTLYATERPASLAFAGEKLVTLDDAGADAQVGIRSFATGALIRSFPVRGHALHVAANETYVAVAVSRGTRVELQRYRMSDGLFVGRRTLAKGVSAPELTMDGTSIVYAGSRRIYAMNAKTGEQRVVATAAALPVGVSILNRRIVWAENVAEDRARVRAVTLPR